MTCTMTHSALHFFEKLTSEKTPKKTQLTTLNGQISKTRKNVESRLQFLESLFNFFQSSVIFCAPYPRGYMAGTLPTTTPGCAGRFAGLKGLIMSKKKNEFALLSVFL